MAHLLMGGRNMGIPPNLISGNTGWYKADAGVFSDAGTTPAVDGVTVYQWNDYAGSSRHQLQVTATNRPTYHTGSMNGMPTVDFDGLDNFMISTGFAWSTFATNSAATVIFVVTMNAVNAGFWYADDNISTQTASGNREAGGGNLQSLNYDGSADIASKAGVATATPMILTWMHGSGNIYAGVTDTRTASLASTASGNTSIMTQTLRLGQTRAVFGNIDLAEFATFNVELAETERKNLEWYYSVKYNITLPYSI